MRRWNGWGDDTVTYPLPPTATEILAALVGPGTPPWDAALDAVVAGVPSTRLPAHPLISTDALERVRHARGQGFPDLIALRSGRIPVFPDGVAYPLGGDDVRALLQYARQAGVRIIPYSGGTSVVGHINPQPGDAPVLTVDLSRMNRLLHLDEQDRLATFGPGVTGPDLEAQLRARGYTLGHYPQSFELSTLGGWIATRSSGQQSLGYGRIEHLFAGGHLESPAGALDLPPFPASAAGPDLRELVLGSEGRLGILTEAIVRVRPLPQEEAFHALFFPDWRAARTAVRRIVQAGIPLSMLRLSTPVETTTTLALAGHAEVIRTLERLLAVRHIGAAKCMLVVGFTGPAAMVAAGRTRALAIARAYGAVHLGRLLGRQWQRTRFRAPYQRNELWERGYGVDTVETATTWSNVPAMLTAVEAALRHALGDCGERVHVFTHLSHLYPQGSSLYTTFLFRLAAGPAETYERWHRLKTAASRAIVAHGGTISHQHGVGVDHQPYLAAEKGPLGIAAIANVLQTFDPEGLLNPGKLV
jgi:alkyldihydroxyacetonephosphate synthase